MILPTPVPLRAAGLALALSLAAPAQAAPSGYSGLVVTEDVTRFFQVYDAAQGHPTAEQLDRDYLARGSAGLRHLAAARRVTGERMAAAIAKDPQLYERARTCLRVLPAVRTRLQAAFARLKARYPEARLAPVTFAVSRGRPIGMADGEGVVMGLEALCSADFMDPDLENRFVHTIAHEYGHIQQPAALQTLDAGDPAATVLRMSLMEGAAEFTAEMISGDVGNYQHKAWTRGHEAEIEAAFVKDEDSTDLSHWLNNGPGDADHPGDLGYWVGHRIVKAYYAKAADKPRALRDIYELRDPKAFLAASGWRPAR